MGSLSNYKKLILAAVLLAVVLAIGYLLFKRQAKEKPPIVETQPSFADYLVERSGLTPEKEQLKRELVAPVGAAGVLSDGPRFRIDYIAVDDLFNIEIKTVAIDEAKEETVSWFEEKGFSREDICKLRIVFYLGADVYEQVKGSGLIFNPLPDFCSTEFKYTY